MRLVPTTFKKMFNVCCRASSQFMIKLPLKVRVVAHSMTNAKLRPHRFWPCHENRLIKIIQMMPQNLYVSFKLTSLTVD